MQNLKCTNTRLFRESFWPFFGAFVLWCFAFRGFLLDQYPLIEDAISYINNSKYLIDHYLKGRIPLWTNAFYGLPYDFFLSRLGSNNPLYLVIAGLYGLGLPFIFSYLWALAGYYFLGCVGFFMLARRLTDDWLASFFGFLILYFSSLGTRMFDSFIVRLFVPLAWFFYFLAAFFQQPCRKNFLGLVFTSMLLVSTYVPFYFGILVILCVVLFFLLFPSRGVEHVKTLAAFVRKEKWLMVIGVCVLIIALLPGIFLFKSSLDGDYVMTKRNRNVVAGNSLEVDFETVDEWAILEDIAYSVDFSDFRRMKFAVLYIPIVSWVLLLMGFGARFNRRQLFYILLGGILFVIGIPQDFPLHKFLYDHFYVFRLFRNLHFFLWWAVLPCFILLLVEQLKVLGKEMERGKFSVVKICFITAVHAAALGGVLYWYKGVTCTVLSLGLSYVFFMAYFSGRLKGRSLRVIGLCVLAVVGIQPLEVYHYLSRNCAPRDFTYGYENNLLQPLYLNFWDPTGDQTAHYEFYIASTRVQKLADRVPVGVLSDYIKPWFIAYDEVSPCPETEGDWGAFNRALAVGQNRACVDDWPAQNILTRKGGKAVQILGPGQGLDILAYEPNSLKIAVVFDDPKLLVWNDAYHPGWSAFLDGSRIPIYRSNVAFKGIYVPAGRHVVRFQYRTILQYLLRVFTWMVYLAVFIGLIVAIFRKEERA